MEHRVVITHWVHTEVVDFLAHLFNVVPNMSGKSLSYEELLSRSEDADAILVARNDVIDVGFLDRCPRLQVIAGARASGNVDIKACTERGVWVTMAPDVSGASPTSRDEVIRAAALEGAANIVEALLGQRPGEAINLPDRPRRSKRDTAVNMAIR